MGHCHLDVLLVGAYLAQWRPREPFKVLLAVHQVAIEAVHEVTDLLAPVKMLPYHIMGVRMAIHLIKDGAILFCKSLY